MLETGSSILSQIGNYTSGIGAEIAAFDPDTDRLFIVSGAQTLEILDLSDPTNPAQFSTVDLSSLGDGANSVDVKNGVVAIAIGLTDPNDPDNAVQIPGLVAFYDTSGNLQGQVTVGALPDMVTFTPDGTQILVANEGEPSEDYTIDPEGSVSIIDISGGVGSATVTTADFTAFNDRKEELDAKGVRLFGQVFDDTGNVLRDSTVAEDLEPEFIAVSEDSTQAFVTLQENNAVAVLDLDENSDSFGTIIDVLPLGVKDHYDGQPSVTNFEVTGLGPIANEDGLPLTTSSGQTIDLGGLSGLFHAGTNGTEIKFYTIPDRGPNPNTVRQDQNGDGNDDTVRPFALPEYQARIVEITLDTDTGVATVNDQTFLTQMDGTTPITGVSNFVFDTNGNQVDEFPVDADGNPVALDPFGGDFEGIVLDSTDNTFWMVDEYRPAIYQFNADGSLINRFIAQGTAATAGVATGTFGAETLPGVYANRRRNRGFEAVALDETNSRGVAGVTAGAGVLYAFIQTPLDNPDSSVRHSDVIRILAIDTSNGNPVAEYVYFLERNRESGVGVSRVDKIGDAVFDPDTSKFFVIERDSAVGVNAKKFIFEIDLTGATNILGTPLANADGSAGTTLEEMTVDELVTAGIQGVDKIKVTNLPSIGYLAGDKPEGLALLPDGRLAVINDNDFGLLDEDDPDPTDGTVLKNPNPTPTVLGLIDFSGNTLDASDRDDAINLQNWPLFGLFQPDSIAAFTTGDTRYYVTANEGDARNRPSDDDVFPAPFDGEGDLFLDEERAEDLILDPTAFPDAATLQTDEAIGRIDINITEGDLDGDGDYDQLFSFGARSFSIWDEYGNLVFDSSDDFERITAQVNPDFFNSDNDENTFDTRSDAKGPEPEGITVGTIHDRTYAFIGLERVGGIMVYEVTNPSQASFVQYISTRDFSNGLDSEDLLGNSAPEGLKFITADDSPTDHPLLVATYEDTDSVGIFSVMPQTRISDIQGAGHRSPLVGQAVTGVPGMVTGTAFNGFYLQDPIADDNDSTSEGIFVFTGGTPADADGNPLNVGDSVTVDGTVSEFIPGGAATGNLSITQLGNATVTVMSTDHALPEAVLIGANGRLAPSEVVISGDELPADLQTGAGVFNPDLDAIDFYESVEGMRVTIEDAVTVSPTRVFGGFSAEAFTLPNQGAGVTPADGLTIRGGINLNSGPNNTGDQNPERVQLQFDPNLLPAGFDTPALTVGDLLGDVTGVVGYNFGNFEVNVTEEFTPIPRHLEQEVATPAGDGQLTVASYNVLNLTSSLADEGGGLDPDQTQRTLLAQQIVNKLGSPDIIGLQEIQDNNGTVDDGTVDATQTLRDLVGAIAAAGGPTYAFFDAAPVDNSQGGVPGGNIRNAFLYNPDRVELVSSQALTPDLLSSAGVSDPNAFDGSRTPLEGTFTFKGESITVINNHFTSRFGSTPVFGGIQPFVQAGEAEREAQSQTTNDYVDFLLSADPDANIIVTGDLNTFQFTNDLAEILPGTGDDQVLTNLIPQAEADDDAYTFIFDGNSQVLDHLFVTDSLLAGAQFDIVHVNNDFPRDDNRAQFTDAQVVVASDHEPLVARFDLQGTYTRGTAVADGVADAVAAFNTSLGEPLNGNAPGPLQEGRRGINWDGAAVPFDMPADFFNSDPLTRGVVFSTEVGSAFRVSNPGNEEASATDNRFSSLNDTYPEEFTTFSANRLFTPIGTTVMEVNFLIPGTDIPATVNGFGAIFMDVDLPDSTKIDYFDEDGNLLLSEFADPDPQGLSFVSAFFPDNDLARVAVTSGNTPIGVDDDPENGVDVVVMDNFFYGEPQVFTLQLLHASDLEGGVDAIGSAPNFAAIVDTLEDEFDNSLLISAGDNYIPGAFFNAAGNRALRDPLQAAYQNLFDQPELTNIREGAGRVDISIMNLLGFDASAVGNHEFDAGTNAFADIVGTDIRGEALGDVRWLGAQFPYLSANLDFSGDGDLSGLFTSDILANTAFQSTPADLTAAAAAPKLAPATVMEEGGELIGVVGATTQIIASISSPGAVTDTTGGANDMAALAAVLQPVINDLIDGEDNVLGTDDDINKIILTSHLQQIALEQELAGLLSGVDIIIAGGSDTLLADSQDPLRTGDTATGDYPVLTTNLDGSDVAIVSTAGEYSYVGRLVVQFDDNGNIIPESIDANVSGVFATNDAGVVAVTGAADVETAIADSTKATEVKALTDAISNVVNESDGNILGQAAVFIEGRREKVRTEETNLGNLTADANLTAAQAVDPTVAVSLKNGGGLRAEIGTVGDNGELLITAANEAAGKQAGDVSQLDVENSLRFNNGLTLITLTAEQLRQVVEHAVAATAPGATPGQFAQVGGLQFSFDDSRTAIAFDDDGNVTTAGDRIRSLVVKDNQGNTSDVVVQDGELLGNPDRGIRIVTLNFLADGGDGYPYPSFVEADPPFANRVDLWGEDDNGNGVLDDGEDLNLNGMLDTPVSDPTDNLQTFTEFGSEQDALAEFLNANFSNGSVFNEAETAPELDDRIQNLNVQDDSVSNNIPVNLESEADGTIGDGFSYDTGFAAEREQVTANLTDDVTELGTDAVFDNLVGFYQIIDENGGIDTDGNGVADLNPGDAGYARAAITNRVDNFEIRAGSSGNPDQNTTVDEFGNVILAGGQLFAPFVIANGGGLGFDGFVTAEDAETDGVFNDAADFAEDQVTYFSFIGANPDGVAHLKSLGNNVFGFEDLPSNIFSDMDFNDAIFNFSFTG